MKRLLTAFFGAAICAFSLIAPHIAYASEQISNTDSAEQIATQIAQNFSDACNSPNDLLAKDPLLFFDEDGEPEGYIVSYYKEGEPFGYIVLDISNDSLISEYVFEKGILNPFVDYSNLMKSAPAYFQAQNQNIVVKTDPYTYALVNESTGESVNNYGETETGFISETMQDTAVQSVSPSKWSDIFIRYAESSFKINDSKWVTPFLGKSQDEIMSATGGVYACAIVALIDCAEYYDPSFYSDSLGTTFWRLWNYTGSYYDSNNSAQGYTNNDKLCSGFKQYMSTRGQAIQTYEQSAPTWMQYKTNADNWNMSLFCAGIIDTTTGMRSGHTMSVQGYALLEPIGVPNEEIKVLGVHDGWNTYARYLNFYFSNYTDTYGAFFG